MFDHVELPVDDPDKSARFYERALAPLGIPRSPPGAYEEFGALTLVRRTPKQRLHLAFIAPSQAAVDAFHAAGLKAGGKDNGRPGVRPFAPDYYAAYLRDPDGHNIEAVHRSDATRAGWSWLGMGLPEGDPAT